MTEETAKKISELYSRKGELSTELSVITDSQSDIHIGRKFSLYSSKIKLNDKNHNSLKEYTITLLKNELSEVERELEFINCT